MKTVIASFLLASALIGLAHSVPARGSQSTNSPMPEFKSCNVNKPRGEYYRCMEEAVRSAIVLLKNGHRERNIKAFEPFTMDAVNANETQLKQYYTNVKVYGLTKGLEISNFKINPETLQMEVAAYNPLVDFTANHRVTGDLIFKLDGHGKCKISMHELTTKAKIKGVKVRKNGVDYLQVKDFKVEFLPKRVTYDFSNLFSGPNPDVITKSVLDTLNEDIAVFNEQKSGYELAFGKEFRKISNQIFSQIPFDSVFPGIMHKKNKS